MQARARLSKSNGFVLVQFFIRTTLTFPLQGGSLFASLSFSLRLPSPPPQPQLPLSLVPSYSCCFVTKSTCPKFSAPAAMENPDTFFIISRLHAFCDICERLEHRTERETHTCSINVLSNYFIIDVYSDFTKASPRIRLYH